MVTGVRFNLFLTVREGNVRLFSLFAASRVLPLRWVSK